jgi:hypothetical protein
MPSAAKGKQSMTNEIFSDSSTSASLTRIFNTLKFDLKKKYGIEDEKQINDLLKIQGLSRDNTDVIANVERIISNGIIDESLDQNANKSGTTSSAILNEAATVPYSKIIGFRYLYRKLKELYGKGEAKRLTGEMYDYTLAINDSGNLLKIYCFSYDFSKLVLEGRKWGQLESLPPKRVASYIASLNETIHQLSNETCGAVAVSSLFLDIIHILYYREKISLRQIKKDKKIRKYIENCFQTFIHSVNHLSRTGVESPFTNVSIMDRSKLDGLIADNNFGWYYDEIPAKFHNNKQKWYEYIKDGIMELQKIYVDFVDLGDPSGGGRNYRFPVNTLNITKNEKGEVQDKDFLEWVSTKDISKYNIMVSKAGKFANCCFAGEQQAYIEENGIPVSKSFHELAKKPTEIYKVFTKDGFKPAKLVITERQEFYEVTTGRDETFYPTANHKNILKGDEIKETKDLQVGDQLKTFVEDYEDWESSIKIKEIKPFKSRYDFSYCFDLIENDSDHIFIIPTRLSTRISNKVTKDKTTYMARGIFTNNCRLISDADMFDMGGSVSSLGMSQISLGSHRVVSINFNRIALEAVNENKERAEEIYFSKIKDRAEDCAKILKAHKELIADFERRGYQQFITNGYIRFDRLFSTIGLLGLLEGGRNVAKVVGGKEEEILKKTLIMLGDITKELGPKYKININIEQIPGETMCVKARDADQMIFGKEGFQVSDYPLYSNQWTEVWKDISIWDRMDQDGEIQSYASGGSVLHFNISDKPTKNQAIKLINYAIKSGSEHFALNAVYSECSNKHTTFGDKDVCPTCGANITDKFERIVGFFVRRGGANSVRKNFDFPNRVRKSLD